MSILNYQFRLRKREDLKLHQSFLCVKHKISPKILNILFGMTPRGEDNDNLLEGFSIISFERSECALLKNSGKNKFYTIM